jgi:uncharacterized membrane protein YkvA (DUF1232 family)
MEHPNLESPGKIGKLRFCLEELRMMRLLRLWRMGGRDLRVLWFALRHPDRPAWLWPAALAVVFYAV